MRHRVDYNIGTGATGAWQNPFIDIAAAAAAATKELMLFLFYLKIAKE